MSRPDRARCAGCQAPIRWITTRAGKPMPVDPELQTASVVRRSPNPEARRLTLVTPTGFTLSGFVVADGRAGAVRVEGYVPHWATCSRAARFRR